MFQPAFFVRCLLAACVSAAACAPCAAQTTQPADRASAELQTPAERPAVSPAERPAVSPVERAAARGLRFLLARIDSEGMCEGEYAPDNPRHGGLTALCAYALLAAQADHRTEPLKRTIAWLKESKLAGTYAVAMRACAYAAAKDKKLLEPLKSDVRWLIEAAGRNGAYTYTSAAGRGLSEYDNSNAQLAVLGVWAGATRGVKVPAEYWRRVERHWLDQQQIDGGWGYRIPPRAMRTATYGSMTAAGLATLFVCFDTLRAGEFVRCAARPEYKPIARARAWLAKRYTPRSNPGKGMQWYYYWLYSLERVGLASGRKFIAGHDWFAEGSAELLDLQNTDGSWGYGTPAQRVRETALAVLFLARGRAPVLASKLQYDGKWNCRPRDLANWARHVAYTFERPAGWQIVGTESKVADLQDAPILYISGAGPCKLSDEQIGMIRDFVHEGGTVLSEAAGNSGRFTLDMQRIYRRMFPEYPLKRLADTHRVYSLYFSPKDIRGLAGVSNGARLLAIHSPRELSLGLQLGPRKTYKGVFDLLGNVYLMTTDVGRLPRRGGRVIPQPGPFKPAATLRVARLKYNGNYDPEPLAFERLARWMGARCRIKLVASAPMAITALDAAKWPVAAMTGTDAFTLSADELAALKKYFDAGGTLVLDAAGGSEPFTKSVEQKIVPLVSGGKRSGIATHVVLGGPAGIDRVYYRRSLAAVLGADRSVPLIDGVMAACREPGRTGKRLAVIYSRYDLTVGLAGFEGYDLSGYRPRSALAVMTNLLCHAAGVGSPEPKPKPRAKKPPAKTRPAPTTKPAPAASSRPSSTTRPAPSVRRGSRQAVRRGSRQAVRRGSRQAVRRGSRQATASRPSR